MKKQTRTARPDYRRHVKKPAAARHVAEGGTVTRRAKAPRSSRQGSAIRTVTVTNRRFRGRWNGITSFSNDGGEITVDWAVGTCTFNLLDYGVDLNRGVRDCGLPVDAWVNRRHVIAVIKAILTNHVR